MKTNLTKIHQANTLNASVEVCRWMLPELARKHHSISVRQLSLKCVIVQMAWAVMMQEFDQRRERTESSISLCNDDLARSFSL